jgi:hypothetical protein
LRHFAIETRRDNIDECVGEEILPPLATGPHLER